MPDNRFFSDSDLNIGDVPILEREEHHHLTRVMRKVAGKRVEVVNGRGTLANCEIMGDHSLEVVEIVKSEDEVVRCGLAQALCKSSNLELIVQKGSEIGVDLFYIFPGDRSEKGELKANAMRRLDLILRSAVKQCGRLWLPKIVWIDSIEKVPFGTMTPLFGDIDAPVAPLESVGDSALLFVGPEAGFSESEVNYLREGCRGISLHQNVLRCETAAIVGSYLVQRSLALAE